jgi:tetratricopeptide (TPR) repeat protein
MQPPIIKKAQMHNMLNRHRIWGISEYILGLIAIISLFVFINLNMSLELRDPDIWLHLKTGEYIVQHKAIPQTDMFSSTLAGKEWIDHSWLVQVIFYLVFHFAGADNLILLSSVIVTLAFLILFFSVYEQRQHLTLIAGVLFITIFASRTRFNIRPENFSILFFSLYIFLLKRHIRNRGVFLLPLVQLFWVNCHGFFVLGPLLVGIFLLAQRLKRTDILPWEWSRVELLDTQSNRNLVKVFWLVCAISFLNPYSYKGALYPLCVTFNSLGKSSVFFRYIRELLPTWWVGSRSFSTYYLFIVLSLTVFLLNFKKLNVAHFIAWLIFVFMSVRVNRNVIFFNFFAFLTTTDILIKGFGIKKFNFIENWFGKSVVLLKYIIIIILIYWTIKDCDSLLNSRYYIFQEYRIKSSLLGVAANEYPDKAADFILKNNLPDNVFNLFNYGSYLIYRFFPKKKVFIDGRTEAYGDEFFQNYQKIVNLDASAVNSLFKKYDINTILLSGGGFDIGNLAAYFFNEKGWALVYLDGYSLVFLRVTPQNNTLVNKLKIDMNKWQVAKAEFNKIGIRNIFPEPYIKRAWILYYFGAYEQAVNEAKEALRILPSIAGAYNIIGKVYIKQKQYEQAFENLRLAHIYGPSEVETLMGWGDLYTERGNVAETIKIYKVLTKNNPRFAEGYYLLARSYIRIENLKPAIKSLRDAIKLDPNDARFYKELGDILYKNRDLKAAIQTYKNAIALGLGPQEFYKRLGIIRKNTEAQQ